VSSHPPDPSLVVIDMQEVFADPESPWATPGFDELLEPIDRLIRRAGDRVVFTRFVLPETIDGSWRPYYEMWPEVVDPARAAWFDLAEPWRERAAETLDKPAFSKWGPELEALAGAARTLVLCGVATDCCVIATAMAAADAGVFVRIAADACRGIDAEAHERALRVMAGFVPHIEITSVDREIGGRRDESSRTA
jgi:nicotinamidase-related amidase